MRRKICQRGYSRFEFLQKEKKKVNWREQLQAPVAVDEKPVNVLKFDLNDPLLVRAGKLLDEEHKMFKDLAERMAHDLQAKRRRYPKREGEAKRQRRKAVEPTDLLARTDLYEGFDIKKEDEEMYAFYAKGIGMNPSWSERQKRQFMRMLHQFMQSAQNHKPTLDIFSITKD